MARVDTTLLRWWLPYRTLFADGTVRLKGNGLMAIIEYRGPDLDHDPNHDLLVLSEQVASQLGQFGRQIGWSVHADLCVVPAAGDRQAPPWLGGEPPERSPPRRFGAPEPVVMDAPAWLDDVRRRRFEGRLTEQRTVLTVAMRPGAGLAKALETYLRGGDTIAARWEPYLRGFRDFVRTFADSLERTFSTFGGQARRLDADGVLRYLWFAVDGTPAEDLRFPTGVESEAVHRLFDRRLLIGRQVRLDGPRPRHVRVAGILGMPDWHRPELLAELAWLGFPLRVCQRFRVINPHILQDKYRKQLKLAADQQHGIGSRVLAFFRPGGTAAMEPDAVGMARYMVAHEETGDVAFATAGGMLTTTAVTWGGDEAEADARGEKMVEVLGAAGFRATLEGANAPAAFFGSFPATIERNRRHDTLTEGFLVRRMRLTAPWTGPVRSAGPFGGPALVQAITDGTVPFRFDPYVSEAGHFEVHGPTRTGKSTWLCFIGQQWLARHPRGRVVFLDVDADKSASVVSALAAGGTFMSFKTGGLALQPLARVDDPDVRMELAPWLRDIVAVQGYAYTPAVGAAIDEALELIATTPPERRTLSALRKLASVPELRQALADYCAGGVYGAFTDGAGDVFPDARWITVELGPLASERPEIRPVRAALLYRVEQLLDGTPTLVVVDETRLALAALGGRIVDWLARLAKRRAVCALSLHNVDDEIRASGLLRAVMTQCETHVMLAGAQGEHSGWIEELGVTPALAHRLARASRGMALVVQDGHQRLVDWALGPEELALCGVAGADVNREALALHARVGPDAFWRDWLQLKGGRSDEAEMETRGAGAGGGGDGGPERGTGGGVVPGRGRQAGAAAAAAGPGQGQVAGEHRRAEEAV